MLRVSATGVPSNLLIRQALEQLPVSLIGQRVIAKAARLPGIEVGVADLELPVFQVVDLGAEPRGRIAEAVREELRGFRRRRFERERLERADLGKDPIEHAEESREETRTLIVAAVVLLEGRARIRKHERAAIDRRRELDDLVVLVPPRGFGQRRE